LCRVHNVVVSLNSTEFKRQIGANHKCHSKRSPRGPNGPAVITA
jgi:hypothetical protein